MENGYQNFAKSLDIDQKLMVEMLIVIYLDCGALGDFSFFFVSVFFKFSDMNLHDCGCWKKESKEGDVIKETYGWSEIQVLFFNRCIVNCSFSTTLWLYMSCGKTQMLFTKASQADQMNHLTEHLENSSNKDLSSISIKCEACLCYWSGRSWAGVLGKLVVSLMGDACPRTPVQFLGMWNSRPLCSWDCVAMSKERRMGESS